jgi:hypothetical protein
MVTYFLDVVISAICTKLPGGFTQRHRHMPRPNKHRLSTYERSLMRAMHLKHVRQLDKLLSAPTSKEAELTSEPPDEVLEMFERALEWQEIQWSAQKRFEALSETRYLN